MTAGACEAVATKHQSGAKMMVENDRGIVTVSSFNQGIM
jgi:hypothetical protein